MANTPFQKLHLYIKAKSHDYRLYSHYPTWYIYTEIQFTLCIIPVSIMCAKLLQCHATSLDCCSVLHIVYATLGHALLFPHTGKSQLHFLIYFQSSCEAFSLSRGITLTNDMIIKSDGSWSPSKFRLNAIAGTPAMDLHEGKSIS